MNNIPLPVKVDKNDPSEADDRDEAPGTLPTPELLRSFVYREPTGLHPEDDDSHPHRRRTDRVPQK